MKLAMDGSSGESVQKEPNRQYYVPYNNRDFFNDKSPRSPLSTARSPGNDSLDLAMDAAVNTSIIDQLYHNICEMQSSDNSLSRRSFLSYGEESRIDSELRYYAGVVEFTTKEEEVMESKGAANNDHLGNEITGSAIQESDGATNKKGKAKPAAPVQDSSRESPRNKSWKERPPTGRKNGKGLTLRKPKPAFPAKNGDRRPKTGFLGPYLLKQVKGLISSGDDSTKALELAIRAMKSFESSENSRKSNLEFVMCLHVVAALYCRNGRYSDAIPVLERSIEIPVMDEGQNHALAKFAGCMQLGDTYAIMGQIENSILCYTAGLEIQRQFLGEKDIRVAETCRYLAEAHVQALQFDEAENLCKLALETHKESGSPASPEEAADRRLMGLICDSKGDYEAALEHYVLASMAMSSNGQESDVAYVDCNIGDAYLSLARYDEAIFAYQKALTVFKSIKGENHPSVASVFVRLAGLYNKIGKFRESRSYCENALRIYAKPIPGKNPEEIASGLVEISAIYESMNEIEQALKLLQKAHRVCGNAPVHQSTIAGIEAQMGVLFYMMGIYSDSYQSLRNAISKFRETGEKKSALFGVALNQMGLACVQLYAINEAADLFEESRNLLEVEFGPFHPDTLAVYSNLAGTYDAMGRTDDAIEILEYVVGMREEKLGTANPEVDDEKRRLDVLLKEVGRGRSRKAKSLENLLHTHYQTMNTDDIIKIF